MGIRQAFKRGMGLAAGHKRMILTLWLINIVVALSLAIPFHHAFQAYIQNTLAEETMTEGFDWAWYLRFQYDQRGSLVSSFNPGVIGYAPFFEHLDHLLRGNLVTKPMGLIVGTGLLYLLVTVLLNGGIVGVFANQETAYSTRHFLRLGATYWGRFFRLGVLSLALYYALMRWGVGRIRKGIPEWTQNAPSEVTPFTYYLLLGGLTLLVLFFLDLGIDYAKIRTVIEDRRSMLLAALAGFWFAVRYFIRTYGLYLLIGLLALVLMLLYSGIEGRIPQNSTAGIAGVFALQQLFILAMLWIKCTFYAGQLALFKGLHLQTAEEEATTVEEEKQGTTRSRNRR